MKDIEYYESLTDEQILQKMATRNRVASEINVIWRKRHGINFPYRLSAGGNIINCYLKAFMADREVDKAILEQANKVREEKGLQRG